MKGKRYRSEAKIRILLIGICFLAAQPPRWGFNLMLLCCLRVC